MKVKTEKITEEKWFAFLRSLLEEGVSKNPKTVAILRDIEKMTYLFEFTDRPDLSYWQEYIGNGIIVHEGLIEAPTVVAVTTLEAYIEVTSGESSIMEAMAEEKFDIKGDSEKLMAAANIIPFVIEAYKEIGKRGEIPWQSEKKSR